MLHYSHEIHHKKSNNGVQSTLRSSSLRYIVSLAHAAACLRKKCYHTLFLTQLKSQKGFNAL